MGREKRLFYRLGYPKDFRPKLIIGESEWKEYKGKEYKVLDICERGVKFTSEAEVREFEPSSKIEAQITFADDELLVVNGEVLRCSENQVVIYPSREISSSRMGKEQEFVETLHKLDLY